MTMQCIPVYAIASMASIPQNPVRQFDARTTGILGTKTAPDDVSREFDPSTAISVGRPGVVVDTIAGTTVGATVGKIIGLGLSTTVEGACVEMAEGARVDGSTMILEGASEEEDDGSIDFSSPLATI